MEPATITVRPAAGPLTEICEPLKKPVTKPPAIPATIPENKGAPEANAIPRHSGRATKKTTTEAARSLASVWLSLIIIKSNIGQTKDSKVTFLDYPFTN